MKTERLAFIDVFRGVTIAGMLIVNDPGDMARVFTPLAHSPWHGWTPADLVFPFFLFLVGVTTQLSLAKRETAGDSDGTVRRATIRRAAIMFGLGLLLNAYPFFDKNALAGPAWMPLPVGHIVARLASLRIMGVLQRIGLVYLLTAIVSWKAGSRKIASLVALLLLGYWFAMTLLPVPNEGAIGSALLDYPGRTLAAWVDRSLLDWTSWGLGWHLWDRAIPYDPEGLFSTIPAVGTSLIGVLAGRWLQSPRPITERLLGLSAVGAVVMAMGGVWGWMFPINKPIWTSSYVLFTAGAACISLATAGWVAEVMQWKRGITPFLVFGTNPILAYVGGELLASILRSSIKWKIDGHRVSTGMAVVQGFEVIGVEARVASALWAIVFVMLCYALLRPLYTRRIFLRV